MRSVPELQTACQPLGTRVSNALRISSGGGEGKAQER